MTTGPTGTDAKSSWGVGMYNYKNLQGFEESGYGFYRPENPHDFFPDPEMCTPEEILAHREACRAWDLRDGYLAYWKRSSVKYMKDRMNRRYIRSSVRHYKNQVLRFLGLKKPKGQL